MEASQVVKNEAGEEVLLSFKSKVNGKMVSVSRCAWLMIKCFSFDQFWSGFFIEWLKNVKIMLSFWYRIPVAFSC